MPLTSVLISTCQEKVSACTKARRKLTKKVLVSRHATNQGASHGKRGAREREETVQARTVGITDLGADRVVADKAQTYWPRLEGLAPWFLRNANCQDFF
jgi:hypothetical protein